MAAVVKAGWVQSVGVWAIMYELAWRNGLAADLRDLHLLYLVSILKVAALALHEHQQKSLAAG